MKKIHRFFTNKIGDTGNFSITDSEIIHQIKNVLKLKAGEKIAVFDGTGREIEGEIFEVKDSEIKLTAINKVDKKDSKRQVTLYAAILKKENFELLAQKATEIGIDTIQPIITDRTIKLDVRIDRLQKIIKEAAEQSGRNTITKINEPQKLGYLLKENNLDSVNIIFNMDGSKLEDQTKPDKFSIWIGPEGGWTQKEIDDFRSHGFQVAKLGDNTYRGETAAIVASWWACS